jgi:hypothetical protein
MREALELLWLDPTGCPRLRRKPEWRAIVDASRAGPPPPDLPNQPASAEDRALALAVLTKVDPSEGAALRGAVAAGVRADGKFAPPLLVVDGELRFGFDALEVLKGLAANAIPFAADDEALGAAIAAAAEYASLPGLLATPLAVLALSARLREAFARAPRGVPASFLDDQTQRALLEHRRYQTHVFRGAPRIRILLHAPGEAEPLLVFAPPSLALCLPLQERFAARVAVEAHVFSDQYDPRPFALQLIAVARRLAVPAGAETAGATP